MIAAAAAARRRAIARVLDVFRVAGATGAERAQSLTALGLAPDPAIDMLCEVGVLKPGTAPESWYLDEVAYVAHRDGEPSGRRRRILVIVAIALAILLLVLVFVLRSPQPVAA